jgi:hypothetical protein
MRHLITLAESVGATDKAAICAKMTDSLVQGLFWDDQAHAAYPGKFQGSDNGARMIEYWREGDFNYPFPDQFADMEDIDVQDTPEFRAFAMWWCDNRYDEVIARLTAIEKHSGLYSIHRIMKVPTNWAATVQRIGQTSLGIYWTYDPHAWDFEPVWSDLKSEGVNVVIHAVVDPSHIDWHHTIMAGMDWETGENEYELRVLKGSPLFVQSVIERYDLLNEKPINLTNITYTA